MTQVNILVIGLGLIGGSIARSLEEIGFGIYFVDDGVNKIQNPKNCYCNATKFSSTSRLKNKLTIVELKSIKIDIVVVSTPLRAYDDVFGKILKTKPLANAVITDVGSVKTNMINHLLSKYPKIKSCFVPSHPIAGKENSGFENSDNQMLKNKICIITPTAHTRVDDIEIVKTMWQAIGMSVKTMKPQEHDEIYACVSHLPQFISFLLHDFFAIKHTQLDRYYDDFLRLAKSPRHIWDDIFVYNSQFVSAYIQQFFVLIKQKQFASNYELCLEVSNSIKELSAKYQKFGGSGLKTITNLSPNLKNKSFESKNLKYKKEFLQYFENFTLFN